MCQSSHHTFTFTIACIVTWYASTCVFLCFTMNSSAAFGSLLFLRFFFYQIISMSSHTFNCIDSKSFRLPAPTVFVRFSFFFNHHYSASLAKVFVKSSDAVEIQHFLFNDGTERGDGTIKRRKMCKQMMMTMRMLTTMMIEFALLLQRAQCK